MTQKFGRRFQVTIDPKDGGPAIVISNPFTMRFWIKRDIMSSMNNTSVDLYNLSLSNRKRIFQDRFILGQVQTNGVAIGRRSIVLQIGYGQLYTVYSGDIFTASSSREGRDIITRIEGLTGAFPVASGQVNTTLPAGTTWPQMFAMLVGQMPNLQVGFISQWPGVFQRPVVLNGQAWDLIQQYSAGACWIDNGKVYVMLDTDALGAGQPIPNFDASSGVLETPKREGTFLTLTTLLEASINIGQLVNVTSSVEPGYNGQYKVNGVQHAGTISDAVSGDCRSTFFLNAPNPIQYTQRQSA